jgi:hypothetical protein
MPTKQIIAFTHTITSWGARMLNLRATHKHYTDYPTNLGGGGTMLQAARSGVRFRMQSLDFLIDLTLPAAL